MLIAACSDAGDVSGAAEVPADLDTLPATTSHQDGVELPGGLTTIGIGGRCVECHEDAVRHYASSAMHDALSLPEGEGSIEAGLVGTTLTHPETGFTIRFELRDGRYVQTLFYADPTGVERTSFTAPIDLVLGSGGGTRSYLHASEGRLLELPLTWTRTRGLALGSGFWERTLRHTDNQCIACHTGDVTPVRADANVGFTGHVSLGVSCERCHGASDDHVQSGDPATTVNPARLDPVRQEQLCAQCHLPDGISIQAPDRTLASYAPGADLGEWLSIFRPDDGRAAEHAAIAGYGARMRRSRCFTATEDAGTAMTCSTCHNPHAATATGALANRGCLGCHEQQSCAAPEGRAGAQPCATCHMPVATAGGGAHTKATDHWIRRVPPPPAQFAGRLPHIGDLALAGGGLVDSLAPRKDVDTHALRAAQAYARGAEMARVLHDTEAETWSERAFALSGAHLRRHPDDGHALQVRGRILTFKGETEAAREALERASTLRPDLPGPTAELAYAYAEAADFETAAPLLARVLDLDPYDEDVAIARARVLVELDRRVEALAVLEEMRDKLGPSVARSRLAVDIANGGDDLTGALRHVYDVLVFLPRHPGVQTKAGEILGALGETERARVHLNEALRLDPSFAPARDILSQLDSR